MTKDIHEERPHEPSTKRIQVEGLAVGEKKNKKMIELDFVSSVEEL
jgi:hypothetical protein